MVILHGDSDLKEVALVFDDGPNPLVTPRLLKVLENKQVQANFFLIGMRAEQAPEIVMKMASAGHEIGNHTNTHKRLTEILNKQGKQAVEEEVIKAKRTIENIISKNTTYFRPPYLDWNEEVEKIVSTVYGDNVIMSGLVVGDWDWGNAHHWEANDSDLISSQAKRINETWQQTVKAGTVLCFHDSSEHGLPGNKKYETWINRALPTLEAIPVLIDFLQENGYHIKKLSDMKLIKEPHVSGTLL